jgi:two-component system CitB family sensor kinase
VTTGKLKVQRRPRLSTQIVLLQLTIIVLTVGAGLGVSLLQARHQIDRSAGQQSLAIARTVSQIPAIREAFKDAKPWQVIDPIAEGIRHRTGAAFVVVANREGIRYSHPDPAKIGQRVSTDPSEALSGKEFVGVQTGTLGRSMRAKVPLRDANGRIIGIVSVGVLESTVSAHLRTDLPVILIPPLFGLALGAAGSVLLARRIKRQTFGLEPDEIGALLEQREAMLHGIREGTVATDSAGRITLLNDEAQRLLGLDATAVGRQLTEAVPEGHVREVLAGKVDGPDQVVLVGDRVLVANRMPVSLRGRAIGAVVTLRDRTELVGLLRELDDVRSLAAALRAQEHEFSHRLHVISGLIELGRHEDAVKFINQSSTLHQALATSLVDSVGDPVLVALVLGKAAVAAERGVELRVAADSNLPEELGDVRDLVTVIGNLVDNALDAVVSTSGNAGWIEVSIRGEAGGIVVSVHDSGPGIEPELMEEIFRRRLHDEGRADGCPARARARAREPGRAAARRLRDRRERRGRALHGVPAGPRRGPSGGRVVIRTLVVDDDFMAASIHRSFTERVPGFEVVGEALTGARALELIGELEPDLVLLDIYLPDLGGLEVMRRVREAGRPPVDFIAITSAKDVQTLRGAMHGGVIHYLVKPFSFSTFRERLESYAALKSRLDRISEADQHEIDRLYSLLRAQGEGALPKGISSPTLTLVVEVVRESPEDLSAAEVARRAGISRGTARRYLEFLADSGSLDLTLKYGAAGRPEHLYRWAGRVGTAG